MGTAAEPRTGLGLRVAALSVLVFGCGVFSGMLLERELVASPERGRSSLELALESYYERFVADFRLDARQQVELRLVLEERAKQQKDWWTNRFLRDDPRDRAELVRLDRSTQGVIREILREDQRTKFNEMLGAR